MSFKSIFIAVFIGTSLIITAIILNQNRPEIEVNQPNTQFVKAVGKCAECHLKETAAMVIEFEMSQHAVKGVTCIDCHRPVEGQTSKEHHGFTISTDVTSKNCAECHPTEYKQYERSRHAAPAFAAVHGKKPFTEAQIAFSEKYHKGAVDRAPNALAYLEGEAAITSGCESCHSIGKPNADGSIGNCTEGPLAFG